MRRVRRRAELAKREAEIEDARPFVPLAREIHEEVARTAAGGSDAETLVDAIEAIPRRERLQVARAVFERLPSDQQWTIIERVFGDDEIRLALEAERQERLADARRLSARRVLTTSARAADRLDTRDVPADERLTLGLFRESDVHAAMDRGHQSSACARRLVLRRRGEPGTFQVVEDVFNPAGGYFVTDQYDEEMWRTEDRLPAHALVRAGSITEKRSGRSFEPVLHIGGRADFELEGELFTGRLHLGYLMVGDDDVFAKRGPTS